MADGRDGAGVLVPLSLPFISCRLLFGGSRDGPASAAAARRACFSAVGRDAVDGQLSLVAHFPAQKRDIIPIEWLLLDDLIILVEELLKLLTDTRRFALVIRDYPDLARIRRD